jgi:hypothetical protein
MDGAEQVDRRALMEVYGYGDRGVFGMIRLYCRQTHGPGSEFASWQCSHCKTASGAAEAHGAR